MTEPTEYAKMEQILLEQLQFKMRKIVGRHTLQQMSVSVDQYIEHMAGHIAFDFETKILGQKNPQKYSVVLKYPKNWWQRYRLKHGWFPFKPIKYREATRVITLHHYALMPKWSKDIGTDVVMHTHIPYDEPGVTLEE